MRDGQTGFVLFLIFIVLPALLFVSYLFGYVSGYDDLMIKEKTKYTIHCVNTTDNTFEDCEKMFEKRYNNKEI